MPSDPVLGLGHSHQSIYSYLCIWMAHQGYCPATLFCPRATVIKEYFPTCPLDPPGLFWCACCSVLCTIRLVFGGVPYLSFVQ